MIGQAEWEELRSIWKSAGWPVRLIGLATVFSSTTALANLADGIVAWRGAFRTFLDFYREEILVVFDVFEALMSGVVTYSDVERDLTVLAVMFASGFFRTDGFANGARALFGVAVFCFLLGGAKNEFTLGAVIFFFVGPLFIVLGRFVVGIFQEKHRDPWVTRFSMVPLMALTLVFVAALINAGFSQPLSS